MSVKDSDSHKLMYHPVETSKWLKNELDNPIHAEVGITNKCNHRCVFCTLDWINHGVNAIEKEVMFRCLKSMSEIGIKSIYYAGEGEPTIHPNFVEFLDYGKKLGISNSVSTNGSRFDEEMARQALKNLSWMRFSVDAGTNKTYSHIHGTSEKEFDRVINNIKNSVIIKRENKYEVDIGVQLILMPENIGEVEALANIVKEIGVDNFQVKPAHNHPKSSYSPEIYQFSHHTLKENLEKLNDDKFTVVVRTKSMERLLQERTYKTCHGFDFYALIDAKGNVVPCNVFYDNPEYTYGNINETDFKEIWQSQRRKEIISKISGLCFKQCGNYRCRLDVMNRYLERIKSPEKNDEFI